MATDPDSTVESPVPPANTVVRARGEPRSASYRDIFKSTSIIGGANVLVILIRLLRTKAIALLIGPEGYGLAGLLQSATDLIGTAVRLGLPSAAVREIATAAAAEDREELARSLWTIRAAVLATALVGAVFTALFSQRISVLTFGDASRATAFVILASVVFLATVAQGQFAILRGMRRIRDLAVARVLGTVFGTVAGIGLLAAYGLDGVVPLIVAGALFSFCISWWFLRRAAPPSGTAPGLRIFVRRLSPLLSLGFTFLLTGLAVKGMGYAARVMVGQSFGTEGVGLYSAAWGISGLFVGFVLQAMGTDFYPRLSAAAHDPAEMCALVNEQTTVGVLLASPGILLFLALAPYLIRLFYSAKFLPATNLLLFMLLGMAVRVVAWPLGYVMVAKMANRLYLATEILFVLVYLVFLWIFLPSLGLVAAGVGWLMAYLLLSVVYLLVVRRLINFHWTGEARSTIGIAMAAAALVFAFSWWLPPAAGAAGGVFVALGTSWVFLRRLEGLLDVRALDVIRQRLFGR